MTEFCFENWLDSLSSSEDIHDCSARSFLDLIANGLDYSKFFCSLKYIPNDIALQKDQDGKLFVELPLPRERNDISTNFFSIPSSYEVKVNLNINENLLPIATCTKIINCCAMYTEIKIRWTFENLPFPVQLDYVSYLLQTENRNHLIIKKTIIQDRVVYDDGVATIVNINA